MVAVVGFMGKFRDLKPEFEGGNWFYFDAAIDGPAVVCGTEKLIVNGASGATTVLAMSETATGFFSAQGFS